MIREEQETARTRGREWCLLGVEISQVGVHVCPAANGQALVIYWKTAPALANWK